MDYVDTANGADGVAAKDTEWTVAHLAKRAVLFKRYLLPIKVVCHFPQDVAKLLTASTCLN